MKLSVLDLAYLSGALTEQINSLREEWRDEPDQVYMAELILLRQKLRDERKRKALKENKR